MSRCGVVAVALAMLTSLFTATLSAATAEKRTHELVATQAGMLLAEYTIIEREDPDGERDERIILVADLAGERLVLSDATSWIDAFGFIEVTHLGTGRTIRLSSPLPFPRGRRDQVMGSLGEGTLPPNVVLERMRQEFSRGELLPVMIRAGENHWTIPQRALKIHQLHTLASATVRTGADAALIDAVDRLRLVGVDRIRQHKAVLLILNDGSGSSRETPAIPDCAFDASFGFPCSARQEERARELRMENKPHASY